MVDAAIMHIRGTVEEILGVRIPTRIPLELYPQAGPRTGHPVPVAYAGPFWRAPLGWKPDVCLAAGCHAGFIPLVDAVDFLHGRKEPLSRNPDFSPAIAKDFHWSL